MKNIFLSLSLLCCGLHMILAQQIESALPVSIGGAAPASSAMLDVSSTNKGVLIPRMTSAQRTAIAGPVTGLLVYQTDGSAGFYYYTGSSWVVLASQTNAWSTTGNAGTDPATHFIGTIDAQPIKFRLNKIPSGYIDDSRNVALGLGALQTDTLSFGQVAIGAYSLNQNQLGYDNQAVGDSTLHANEDGSKNVASGSGALRHNLSGSDNVATGHRALYSNVSGYENIAFGVNTHPV